MSIAAPTSTIDDEKQKAFDTFQLEEYKNISNSHFESIQQLSNFFRYYLVVLTAPVFIITVFTGTSEGSTKFFSGTAVPISYNFAFFYLALVSFAGFLLYLYVINVRFDAILYARTVNKVRRYFYERSDLKIERYQEFLSLPVVSTRPKYFEKTFFLPLLLLFASINCGLIVGAFRIKLLQGQYFASWFLSFDLPLTGLLILILVGMYFILHLVAYQYLAYRRDNFYLKSYSIGLDIDGVLNNQTDHFAEWLQKLTGKTINTTQIFEIPVQLNTSLGVTDDDEKIVFNTKEYWETLVFKQNAARRINEFHKRFGYNILFFSYRDWPQYGNKASAIKAEIMAKGFTPLKKNEISQITSKWLSQNEIQVVMVSGIISSIWFSIRNVFINNKRAIIEMGNPYVSDNRFWSRLRLAMLTKNRFQDASIEGFKFFVEDFPENAIRLSGLCDYVFMFDEPYNQDLTRYHFPKNVIRVKSWDDIYRYLKLLS